MLVDVADVDGFRAEAGGWAEEEAGGWDTGGAGGAGLVIGAGFSGCWVVIGSGFSGFWVMLVLSLNGRLLLLVSLVIFVVLVIPVSITVDVGM